MTVYSYAQLEQLWINAGGSRPLAPVAAAIAEAESGGDSAAMNYTDNNGTQTSVGLWQVSNGTHQYPASWTTPQGNAAEAVAKYNGAGGWSPWGTYDSGAYRQYLSPGTTPDANVPSSGGGGTQQATTTGLIVPADLPSTCVVSFGGIPGTSWVTDIFGSGGNFFEGCLLSKSEARAVIGGLILTASFVTFLAGTAILAASVWHHSGAQRAVQAVPGVSAVRKAVTRSA